MVWLVECVEIEVMAEFCVVAWLLEMVEAGSEVLVALEFCELRKLTVLIDLIEAGEFSGDDMIKYELYELYGSTM